MTRYNYLFNVNHHTMESNIIKKIAITLEFDKELLDRAKEKANGRNLNDYIEILIRKDIWHTPNAETMAAIEEAHSGVELESITVIDKFLESL